MTMCDCCSGPLRTRKEIEVGLCSTCLKDTIHDMNKPTDGFRVEFLFDDDCAHVIPFLPEMSQEIFEKAIADVQAEVNNGTFGPGDITLVEALCFRNDDQGSPRTTVFGFWPRTVDKGEKL